MYQDRNEMGLTSAPTLMLLSEHVFCEGVPEGGKKNKHERRK
jgi:hypothetical protein